MKLKKLFKIRYFSNYRKNGEKGQALAIVLTLLLLVSLVVASALTFVGTSLKTNVAYANSTNQLYAAEAGIQDGVWQVLNQTTLNSQDVNGFHWLNGSNSNAGYVPYDYYDKWQYALKDPNNSNPATNLLFNGFKVNITLENTWVPLVNFDAPQDPTPVAPTLNDITTYKDNITTVISGQVTTIPVYNGKITYTGTNTSSSSLPIYSIGCWLPQGFTYRSGSSTFFNGTTPLFSNTDTPVKCAGNWAMVWTFPAGTTLYSLQTKMPGQTPGSQVLTFNFSYTTSLTKLPECLPWVVWGNAPGDCAWDTDITVNHLVSEAGSDSAEYTDIEAYVPKSSTSALGNALAGDYVAIGGSNLIDQNGDGLREHPLTSSNDTVTTGNGFNQIPAGSSVQAAYLYWGGWVRGDADTTLNPEVTKTVLPNGTTYFYDNNVTLASDGGGSTGGSESVTIDTSNSDDIYWSNSVQSGRGHTITFSNNNPVITENGTGDDLVVGDKITTTADGSSTWYTITKITNYSSTVGITVSPAPLVNSGGGATPVAVPYWVFDGYYYACKVDVTNFVRDYSAGANLTAAPQVFGSGAAGYTVYNVFADTNCVQDAGTICTAAWAGWSLVIVYSNPNTLGHQLYLFDNFQSIATNTGSNLSEISGFIVPYPVTGDTNKDAVTITAFVGEGDGAKNGTATNNGNVGDYFAIRDQSNPGTDNILWDGVTDDINPVTHFNWDNSPGNADVSASALDAFNSESVGLVAQGVDIDTFHVKWTDDILSTSTPVIQTNDTTATLNIYTQADGLVSIYIIASFRSAVTSGGSVSYLIKKSKNPYQ